jgi:hypothetical protein
MLKRILSLLLLAPLLTVAVDRPAVARTQTLEIFDYSYTNWFVPASLTGSFEGFLDSTGHISNLISFLAVYSEGAATEILSRTNLAGFSYNPSGGPSSVDFIGSSVDPLRVVPFTICAGLPAATDPRCNPFGDFPASTSLFLIDSVLANFTTTLPQIELVAKFTIVPEPSTWLMLLAGLTGIGLARARASGRSFARLPSGPPARNARSTWRK